MSAGGDATPIVRTWASCLDEKKVKGLCLQVVLPRLAFDIASVEIEPSDQDIRPFEKLLLWRELLTSQVLASVLDTHFVPKLLQTAEEWLGIVLEEENFTEGLQEIIAWYAGWKRYLGAEVVASQKLQDSFKLVLLLID
jgi:hypothetical protein